MKDDALEDDEAGFRADATVAVDRAALGLDLPGGLAQPVEGGTTGQRPEVEQALRRARALAAELTGGDDELADLLAVDAPPVATVDQASAELARRRFGPAVDGARYRAPRVDAAPITPRALADVAAARTPRADTIDASLHALEDEAAAGGLLDQLAEKTRADDRQMLDEIGRLRRSSLSGTRAATEIPIELDDLVELTDDEP